MICCLNLSKFFASLQISRWFSSESIVQESEEPDWNLWDDICEELSDAVFGYVEPTVDISAIDVLLNVDDRIHQYFFTYFFSFCFYLFCYLDFS